MPSRTQYVIVETLVSMAINTALSVGFVFLAFHGQTVIPMRGLHGIVLDMAPQTFMIVLMACLVPALLTRRRLAAGALTWQSTHQTPSLAGISLTAAVLAVAATLFVVAISWAVLPRLFPNGVSFRPLLFVKAVYGLLLAALVTPWSVANVLGREER